MVKVNYDDLSMAAGDILSSRGMKSKATTPNSGLKAKIHSTIFWKNIILSSSAGQGSNYHKMKIAWPAGATGGKFAGLSQDDEARFDLKMPGCFTHDLQWIFCEYLHKRIHSSSTLLYLNKCQFLKLTIFFKKKENNFNSIFT